MRRKTKGDLLRWRVVHKFNPLLDVALQSLLAGFKELLLVRADLAEDIGRLLCTIGLAIC